MRWREPLRTSRRPLLRRHSAAKPVAAPPGSDDLTLARLTAEAWDQNEAGVAQAFAEHGLDVFAREPDHHYVNRYFGGTTPELRELPTEDPEFFDLAAEVRSHKTTMLYYDRLYMIFQAVGQALAAAPPDGPIEVLEVGVRRGGTSWFLAKSGERFAPGRVHLTAVDTFEGHSKKDLLGGDEGVHSPGKLSADHKSVAAYLAEAGNVDVVKGRIQDVAETLADKRFSFVHLDVDLYEPTCFTLEFAADRLADGGLVLVDDYGKTSCPGVKTAVDEFVAGRPRRWFAFALQSAQCLLIPRG